MRTAAIAFAFVALTAATAGAESEHVTRTLPLAPGGEVSVNNFSGRIRVVGADAAQVTIDAVRNGSRAQLDAVKLDVEQHGSSIAIEANRRDGGWFSWWRDNDVVDTELTITVPRRTNLRLHAFSSSVEVAGVDGDVEVHSFSAPVRLDKVGGRLDVHTFSGPIAVTATAASDRADAIVIDTFSGAVDVRMPAKAHATADFRSFSGRLTSSAPLLLHSTSRRSTSAELEGEGPAWQIRVKTFSGNFTLDR